MKTIHSKLYIKRFKIHPLIVKAEKEAWRNGQMFIKPLSALILSYNHFEHFCNLVSRYGCYWMSSCVDSFPFSILIFLFLFNLFFTFLYLMFVLTSMVLVECRLSLMPGTFWLLFDECLRTVFVWKTKRKV